MKCLSIAFATLTVLATTAHGDVFHMGSGLTSVETVPVGNLGNIGEWSGKSYGGSGPNRISGAVDYAYNMGKYLVTAGQYTEFLNAVADTDPYGLYNTEMRRQCKIERYDGSGTVGDPYQYQVAANYANRPVNYVNWGDAARFANWLHNGQPTGILTGDPALDAGFTEDGAYDLNGATSDAALMAVSREADWKWAIPSEDEWYKAAFHKNDGDTANYFDYSTSSDTIPGYVNDSGNLSGTGTPFSDGVTDPGNYATFNGDGGPAILGSNLYYRTEVGEWENSASPYGTFDQSGLFWEWNESISQSGSSRLVRGGAYSHAYVEMRASARRSFVNPMGGPDHVGFRVASAPVPEPSSVVKLAVGAFGLLLYALRKRN